MSFPVAGRSHVGPPTRPIVPQMVLSALLVGCITAAPPTAETTLATPPPTASALLATPTSAPPGEGPPGALLAVAGAGAHAAEIGSYDYLGAGSDSPWLPARALDGIAVDPGEELTIRLERGVAIGPWAATVAAAADDQAVVKRLLAEGGGVEPKPEIAFAAPRSGSWVLMAAVRYADGSGSAAYYWQIDVR